MKDYLWENVISKMYQDESPKRFDRIVAILIQLQSKKVVKAQELADRFDVSLRTIYRDIRTLEASGVPIYSEAGVGYSLVDGYRLPPVMFTREEAGSFVAAEKLMQKFTDKSLGGHFQSAMYKIKSVLRGAQKDWIEAIESKIQVSSARDLFDHKIPDVLEILFESIAEKLQILVLYQSLEAESPVERVLEPVGMFHENNRWYILGYCHLRKEYRQFRTDRIQDIKRTHNPFQLQHKELDFYLNKETQSEKVKIRILIDKQVARYLESDKRHYGFISEESIGNNVEMTFEANYILNGFARWYMMFGDYAQILEPEDLKQKVKELLVTLEDKLNS